MTLRDLQTVLNREHADNVADSRDIPREFRRGSPPMYYNNARPLAWDNNSILVRRRVEAKQDDDEFIPAHWRYAMYSLR
jgi:hypothetical protein